LAIAPAARALEHKKGDFGMTRWFAVQILALPLSHDVRRADVAAEVLDIVGH
jgi:hypothetical protein